MSKKALVSMLLGSAATLSLMTAPAMADAVSDEIQDLRARLDRLEKLQAQQPAPAAAAPAAAATPEALKTDQNGNMLGVLSRPVMLYTDDTSSVHLYGLVEATIGYASNQNDKGAASVGFQTAWFSGNRWGIDADHALAFGDQIGLPGLKVIAKLESEFELPSGGLDTNGNLFNRDAWLGLYSPDLGKVTFGRQNTLTRDFTSSWGDAYGSAEVGLKEGGYSNVNNFKQNIFYSGAPSGTRLNSAIEWKKIWGQHIVTGLGYGFCYKGNGGSSDPGIGGGLPGDNANGSSQEVSIAYNKLQVGTGKINLNASYNRANNDDLVHQAVLVGGNYTIGAFRFNLGGIRYLAEETVSTGGLHNLTRADWSWTASSSVFVTPKTEIAAGYVQSLGHNSGLSGAGKTLIPFLQDTRNISAVSNGSKGTFYGSVMFHADKQTDFYVAGDYMKVHGGWAIGDAQGNADGFGRGFKHNDEVELATGIRFKF
jgi:predicted porin